jgi:Spy/CpxP family protein refolding chaperone
MKTIKHLFAFCTLALFHAAAAPNPIESDLFPPDFLLSQREALGLTDAQVQDMQSVVQDVQPKFENLKGQLEERSKTFREALHQDKPDIAKTEDTLHAMLTQENEMKVLQVHLLLTLRSKLTPDQLAKARDLRAQNTSNSSSASGTTTSSSAPTDGLRERLQAKFEQLKSAVQAQASTTGQPPEEIVAKAHEIQQLVQNGKPEEAEKQLDTLLTTLNKSK